MGGISRSVHGGIMRLIDADALAKFIDYGHLHNPNEKAYSENDIREMIDMMPTADAVPVIRCKDCKRLGVANMKDKYGQPNPVPCCRRNGHIRLGIKPDDYCSRAERKEE